MQRLSSHVHHIRLEICAVIFEISAPSYSILPEP